MRPMLPAEPKEQVFTEWHNPTKAEVVMDLYVGPQAGPSGRVRYRVPAGGKTVIPSELDRGVHDVREGVIMGGMGTMLTRVGTVSGGVQTKVEQADTLHPCLDPVEVARKAQTQLHENALLAQAAAQAAIEAVGRTQAQANGKR